MSPFLLALCLVATPVGRASATPEPEVLVVLWFDTEDYLLPASDDAAKRVAEILTGRSVRATFKLVGEKARVLERRGRADVIEALKRHDIGYHSDFHSVHPTPAEHLAEHGWADGVAQFVRRERNGAQDVRRIFGVEALSCYGQPGSSWAPQTLAALPALGIAPGGVPCYVDEGTHVGLNGEPFWYCGALTVYHMAPNVTRMDLHREGALEKGCEEFRRIHERLRGKGGGLISIFYHPAEWVHREFWDGVNFHRGQNPPREEWKPPPQRPPEETEAAYRRFERYIDFQKGLPGVRFVTAADLPLLYPDPVRVAGIDLEAARTAARKVSSSSQMDFADAGHGRFLSPADQLVALVEVLSGAIQAGEMPSRVEVYGVLGPSEPPPASEVEALRWPAFRDTLLDVRDELRFRRQVPSVVFAGAMRIAPADFLGACGAVAAKGLPFPESVRIPTATVRTERHVAQDTPGLFGGWIIHREGFRAPRIMEQARLQAWTLKPARRPGPAAR